MSYSTGVVRWIGTKPPALPYPLHRKSLEKHNDILQAGIVKPIILFGDVGVGKTTLLRLLYTVKITEGGKPYWTDAAAYCDDVAAGWAHQKRFSDWGDDFSADGIAGKTPLLFIDDLGAEKKNDHTASAIEDLLRKRYTAELPTWITTNLEMDEFSARYGERIVSRLAERGEFFTMRGADRRLAS